MKSNSVPIFSVNKGNPFYTDTRYDDKICHNDNLTGTNLLTRGDI